MTKPELPTYRTTNWRSYNAALKQRGSLLVWFDPETVWLAEPSGKRGRSATFTDAAIQACLTLKALFGLPLRQATGLVASLLELAGLDWPVPDFSTLCRRQKGLNVAIPYRQSTGALHLLIDSTGIKAEGEGEWFAKKHGPSKPRQWRKVHLGIDADTLEIRAIEVTGSRVGDAPMLPELLDQIPDDQPIGKVSADGAYDTRGCHAASRRAAPAPSFLRAKTRGHGWRTPRARRPETTPSMPPAALAAPSGGAGAAITAEAWSRPKCGASNCSVSASWHGTSTGRWLSSRSAQQS
jgi:IS5 family transposase